MLSKTVAVALRENRGDEVSATATFVEMCDHFFDCLNVNNLSSGRLQCNSFKSPYRGVNDFRLKVTTW